VPPRGEQCREAALQRAGDDQDAEALGQTAEAGGGGEAGEAGDEHSLAADEVADPAAEEHGNSPLRTGERTRDRRLLRMTVF
jgi:hypothetical protein